MFIHLAQVIYRKRKGIQIEIPPGKRAYKFWPDIWLFMIPTLCDLTASTLNIVAVFFSQVSVQNMLRNLNILFVAMFSSAIFKDYRHKFDLP